MRGVRGARAVRGSFGMRGSRGVHGSRGVRGVRGGFNLLFLLLFVLRLFVLLLLSGSLQRLIVAIVVTFFQS